MKWVLLALAVLFAITLVWEIVRSFRTYLRYRGRRIITCPETRRDAAVRVAARKAAAAAAVGAPHIRLSECSRWPERKDCGQDCLAQVKSDPIGCLVQTIVNRWYAGQSCVSCHKPFGEINWHEHPPALADEQGKTVQWNEIPMEKLQEAFATHWPVCWNCHIAERFRREHAELVTNRPPH
jgi:hypothetical protein